MLREKSEGGEAEATLRCLAAGGQVKVPPALPLPLYDLFKDFSDPEDPWNKATGHTCASSIPLEVHPRRVPGQDGSESIYAPTRDCVLCVCVC